MPAIVVPVIPAIIAVISMLFPIVWDVFPVVPVVSHKIHLSVTRIVFIAVFSPMFGVARRNAQIDGRACYRYSFDDHWLRIEKRRSRKIANINLSIKAWLANSHRYPDIACECGGIDDAN